MKSFFISIAVLAAISSGQDTSSSETPIAATPLASGTSLIATTTTTGSSRPPASTPVAATIAEVGCFSFLGPNFSDQAQTNIYMSHGLCLSQCQARGFMYAAIQKNECTCGRQAPSTDAVAPHSLCNQPCAGFPTDTCGGNGVYTVLASQYNNGTGPGASTGVASAGASGTGAAPSGSSSTQPIPIAGAARFSVSRVAAAIMGSTGLLGLL